MACNSVHFFHTDSQKSVNVPIINLIEIIATKAEKLGFKKVGLLSSESTAKLKMFEQAFTDKNIETVCVSCEDQPKLNLIIEAVMAGKHGQKESKILKKIMAKQIKSGAEAIVLGCTELPLAFDEEDSRIPILDSIQILTEYAVDLAYANKKIFITDDELHFMPTRENGEEMVNIKQYSPGIIFHPGSYYKRMG